MWQVQHFSSLAALSFRIISPGVIWDPFSDHYPNMPTVFQLLFSGLSPQYKKKKKKQYKNDILGLPKASELKCTELQQGAHSRCHLDQVTKLGGAGSLFSLLSSSVDVSTSLLL